VTTVARHENEALRPYVPRLLIDWVRSGDSRRVREIEGTLAFVDISGFTKLTERLARRGKVGAEEMNDLLDVCFTRLLEVAYRDAAGLVKWGGDAALLLFDGPDHAARASRAAHGMRAALREMGRMQSSAGFVSLRMSVGIHTGIFQFFLVGDSHRDLAILGPAATRTVLMESTATAGEILVSPETAAAIEPTIVGRAKGEGFLLRGVPDVAYPSTMGLPDVDGVDLSQFVPVGIRDHLLGDREAEHRHVAIAFLEFRGTDELLRTGAETVADALEEIVTTVQEEAGRHAVTFLDSDISSDGGKILLVAGAPTSSGNDEEGMLLAVRNIVDRAGILPIRIGVNAGRVFAADFGPTYRRSYSMRGDAVNLAARIMGRAENGQVLVTDAVLTRSRTPFETQELPAFTVKGKRRPVKAFALGPAGRRRLVRHDASPLIGRESELGMLFAALESAIRRRGSVVELVGEPGIGKSRLVDELMGKVEGVTVLMARCEMYESGTPYKPFRGLLREVLGIGGAEAAVAAAQRLRDRVEANASHLLPWLPLIGIPMDIPMPMTEETAQLDEDFRRERLEAVTEELLEWVLPTPTIFVFDDAHWMDEASADLVSRLAKRAPGLPWLVLVTRREAEGGFRLPDDVESITIGLEPLDPTEAALLVEASTERRPLPRHELGALAERSGGNPLFLGELVAAASRSAGDELPDTVEELMTAEIDRLSAADRALLRHASVLGETFGLDILVEMLGDAAAGAHEEMLRRLGNFVREDEPGTYRFRHALLRDAAYEGLPFRRRRELHASAGDAIARAAATAVEDKADVLSMHFFHAHRYEDAWRYSRIAAQRARAKYALVDACAQYRRAIDAAGHLREVTAADVSEVHEALGDLLDRLGVYGDAAASYRSARRSASGDPVAEAKLLLKEAWIAERRGDYRQALRWVTRGLKALEGVSGTEAGRQRARLYAWYAAIRQGQGRYREVLRWCRRAIEEAEASGEREALAQAYFIMDWAHVDLGEPDEATNSQRALEIYEELGNRGTAATVLNNMGMFAYFRGAWDEAVDLYQRGHDMRLTIGDVVDAAMGPMNIGEILSDRGCLDEAETTFRDVLKVWQAAGRKEFVALTTSNLGRVASRSGRCDEAMAMFDDALGMYAEMGDDAEALEVEARVAECLMLQGSLDDALTATEASLKRAQTIGGLPPQLPLLHRVRGWALLQAGRTDEARRAFEDALGFARLRQADYEIGLTLHALAELGRLTSARDLDAEEQSRDILGRLGVVSVPGVPRG
jgi:class 3 adenylate cyclase/tetratricopeptide (TPR) repeat protein